MSSIRGIRTPFQKGHVSKPSNGKGDKPRHLGKAFDESYDQIDWGRTKERKDGYVKIVYK